MRAVYRVTEAIPKIGAEPGDCIVVEPSDPTHPLVLTRRFSRGVLPVVLDDARLRLLDGPELRRPAASMSQPLRRRRTPMHRYGRLIAWQTSDPQVVQLHTAGAS